MGYVDGVIFAVPTASKEAFVAYAQKAAEVFKRHGAERLVDCWGDDVPEGTLTSFPLAVQAKGDETVVFSWVFWPSKAVRDVGMTAALEDPEMIADPARMPFDGARMIFGGFDVVVDV